MGRTQVAYRPVARAEIARLKRSLDQLFERAFAMDATEEIAGDVNRYLCVRVSGFLEQAVLVLGRSACEQMSGGLALEFALSWLERSSNLSSGELCRFVGRFSSSWGEELRTLLAESERGARLNALIGIRNDIAHGKNQGVSATQALDYYELVQSIIDWIADRLEPKPGMQPASPPRRT